ncbi:ATP-dependent DNA ligase [Nocardioides sambongensis]|uniref:ATP-dependent DNA ligase n=1 Tax=Nocardioides sambongensis TaxID=2589074 RepID=UPI001125DAF5|nr:ATP-dependent DNA ligase [Nocardioides sambongensis]
MLLQDLVATSAAVAATRSRREKTRLVAEALGRAAPDERPLVASYLAGRLAQRRTGLGWRSLRELPAPAPDEAASLAVADVDAAFAAMSRLTGAGSTGARARSASDLFGAATESEQRWLRAVVLGEVRQGASDAILAEALAAASGQPLTQVRRAAMLAGGVPPVVDAAFAGELGGIGLEVGRPVLPMLASSATDLASAWAKLDRPVLAVDTKLDGIRIQVHRDGDTVTVATRSLDDITDRLPEVVAAVRALPSERLVLDGEALLLGPDRRPRPFQETAARTAQHRTDDGVRVAPYFFDLLHVDGVDLLDRPAHERWRRLAGLVPEELVVPRWQGGDPATAAAFADAALASGHEGVVVKDPEAPYAAGRRGSAWIKVKPVHTLDLVVLAVERGSGRRRGWLSNIHLGARDGDGFVMLGKTFKGMTDALLAWQTERFRELEVSDDGWVVTVRPEQVVEIAFDGVQRSTRYPGGVALRFARVVRYRDDKTAAEADTVQTVQALLQL